MAVPKLCVACGGAANGHLAYSQDDLPIVGPGVGGVSWHEVAFPYCEKHARRFRWRFRVLGVFQAVTFVSGLFACCAVAAAGNKDLVSILNWRMPDVVRTILSTTGLALISTSATSFLVKPFLYDAKVKVDRERVTFKARSQGFIEELKRTNQQAL